MLFALVLSYVLLIASSAAAFVLPSPPANITTCPFSAVVRVHPLAVAESGAPSHGEVEIRVAQPCHLRILSVALATGVESTASHPDRPATWTAKTTLAEGEELIRGDWGEGVRFPFSIDFQTPTPPLVVQAEGTERELQRPSRDAQQFVALLTFVTESGAPREVGVPARLEPY